MPPRSPGKNSASNAFARSRARLRLRPFAARLTSRFSETESPLNKRPARKARAIPARAKASGTASTNRRPSRRTSPAVGLWKPERTLMSVVFPAPFGPISPTISPGSSVNETPSIAASPPKRTEAPSVTSAIASGLKRGNLLDRIPALGGELAVLHADDRHRAVGGDVQRRGPGRRADHKRRLVERVELRRHLVAVQRARRVGRLGPGLNGRVAAQAIGDVGLLAILGFKFFEKGVDVGVGIVAVFRPVVHNVEIAEVRHAADPVVAVHRFAGEDNCINATRGELAHRTWASGRVGAEKDQIGRLRQRGDTRALPGDRGIAVEERVLAQQRILASELLPSRRETAAE